MVHESTPEAVEARMGLYDADYYRTYATHGYCRDERWLGHFGRMAERLIADLGPKKVLDVGCALGIFVEALRMRGVEAEGIDGSEYAITHVHESMRPYCRLAQATDPLPSRYDLIVCTEVIEHLPAGDADRVVELFCRHADQVLFSSSPFDFRDLSHFNVRPPDHWTLRFAAHGLYRDVDYDAGYIAPWAMLFRRPQAGAVALAQVLASYERRLWQLEQETEARRQAGLEYCEELRVKERRIDELKAAHARELEALGAAQARALDDLEGAHAEAIDVLEQKCSPEATEERIRGMVGATSWSLIREVARLRAVLSPPGSRRDQALGWAYERSLALRLGKARARGA
jgi:SAM-dependent methyltransferase